MANATAGDVRDWRALFGTGTGVGLSDGELLRRYAEGRGGPDQGGEAAFGVLIERHGGMVLRICRAVLDDRHAAEDAFQSTFLVLARRSRSLRAAETVGPWLHQVALRTARAARSAVMRRKRHEQAAATDRPLAFEDARDGLARDDARAIHEEIGLLPPRYRRVVVLCYLEGLTHLEAAERLRRPVGTVRSRLARGRDILRRRLERRGLAPSILAAAAALPRVPAGLHDATLALAGKTALAAGRLTFGLWAGALAAMVGAFAFLPTPRPEVEIRTATRTNNVESPPPKPPGKFVKIHGRVSDLSGKPIAGATVVAGLGYWRDDFQKGKTRSTLTVESGQDGSYAAELRLEPDEILHENQPSVPFANILAYKPGFAPTASFDDCRTEDVAVDLTLGDPEPYVGLVLDIDKKPVVGATIAVSRMIGPVVRDESRRFLYPLKSTAMGSPLESVFIVKSDESGRFRFPSMPRPARLNVQADAPGMAPIRYDDYPTPGTDEAPAVIGPLQREARLEGHITSDVPGVDVSNRRVRIVGVWSQSLGWPGRDSSRMFEESADVDREGHFQLRGLGFVHLNIYLPGPCPRPEDPWTYQPVYSLVIHSGRVKHATLKIVRGGCLQGRVVDATSGTPVRGVLIQMRPPVRTDSTGFFDDLSVRTDAEGRFSARLAPGSWMIYRQGGVTMQSLREVEVVEGKTTNLDVIKMPSNEIP
jgi:RNA polymerase sigma factor (sigma-70 family)